MTTAAACSCLLLAEGGRRGIELVNSEFLQAFGRSVPKRLSIMDRSSRATVMLRVILRSFGCASDDISASGLWLKCGIRIEAACLTPRQRHTGMEDDTRLRSRGKSRADWLSVPTPPTHRA